VCVRAGAQTPCAHMSTQRKCVCVRGCTSTHIVAQDAGTYGGAIDIEEGGSANILGTGFYENVSRNGSQWAASGAINCFRKVALSVSRCTFRQNSAESGGDGAFGGAFTIESKSVGSFADGTAFYGNSAVGGRMRSFGGVARVVDNASLFLRRCELRNNRADSGNRGGSAAAGAIAIFSNSRVVFVGSAPTGNVASDGHPSSEGGAPPPPPPSPAAHARRYTHGRTHARTHTAVAHPQRLH
jgi:hypothetical protein